MQYMLDTDICSHVIRRRDPRLLAVLQTRARSGAVVCVSAITYAELRLGALRSSSVRRHGEAIQALCDRLSGVLAWGKPQADAFARIQAELLSAGRPIGTNDAMIAAHAFSSGCTLVTNNERHFARVTGLEQENWLNQSKTG